MSASIEMRRPISPIEPAKLVQPLVGLLRERRASGIAGALAPILAERDRALSKELSQVGAGILQAYDELILATLSMRYDALDLAATQSNFAVAEIDGNGLISYANEALKKLLPDALGRDFAALFGSRAEDVREAIISKKPRTLRLDLQRSNLPSVHLRGEMGPLSDEQNRVGAYALLLDVDGEQARFDALPDGILRLDRNGDVVFANKAAKEILGDGSDMLLGRSVDDLFEIGGGTDHRSSIERWIQSSDGLKEPAVTRRLDGRDAEPVRLTIVPSFDSSESRSGWVLTIVKTAKEQVQAELQRLLSIPDGEPEHLIRGIMEAIQNVLPYDMATFGVYTEDLKYHNTLVVHPRPDWAWTTAWFPLGAGVREFLLGDHTWGDIESATAELAPEVEDDQVYHHIRNNGMKRFVTLPITGGGDRVRASLSLLSKDLDSCDGSEIAVMRELGVEKALIVAEANLMRKYEERVRRLEDQLAAATEYQELARVLASGIADCFKWDYVAVFGVDRHRKRFWLIDQCNRTGSPLIDNKYTQDLGEGLLGAALQANAPRMECNLDAGARYAYKPVVPGRRSALAMPIRVVQKQAKPASDEIEWMLCVEASQRNAFRGPNMEALTKLLTQCEGILRQRWHKAVQISLLDAVEQSVIVVDRAGTIRLTNRWAKDLLCRQNSELLGRTIVEFGADQADRRLLKSNNALAQGRVTLSVAEDVTVPALMTRLEINDDYRHQLLLFTDLREHKQQTDWSYLEQTVNEVAQIARRPLMLASSLVQTAADQIGGEPSIRELLEQAVRNLDKADITYERLASTLSVREVPDRPAEVFDVIAVLRESIVDLPEEDVACCELDDLGFAPFLISGWPEQMKFAFRSLLGHLLLHRPSNAKVSIRLANAAEGGLTMLLSVPKLREANETEEARDRISIAAHRASVTASLAPEAVGAAVSRHHGHFSLDEQDGAAIAFRIELDAPTASN
jgi:PAS domain S-box-containing protein